MSSELELQRFLRSYEGLEALEPLWERYGVKGVPARNGTPLYSFKYSLPHAPPGERIVQESRGIVLDSSRDWEVVARPFDRFFNLGESTAAEIDWDSAVTYEKLDGSLMILYHYDGKWRVASSGTPDASGPVHENPSLTFADLFWREFERLQYDLPNESWYDTAFMFEMTTPYNRIVVPYATSGLTLLGARRKTGEEYLPESLFFLRYATPKRYEMTRDQIVSYTSTLKGTEGEGFVVVDKHFNRVKIKSPHYVALARAKDSVSSTRAVVEIVREGETSEVEVYFPELADKLQRMRTAYGSLLDELRETYLRLEGIEDQKEFALEAQKTTLPAALFAVRSGKAESVEEFLRTCRVNMLEKALKEMDREDCSG